MKLRVGFLKKMNKIDKPLARLLKKRNERTQIGKITNGRGEITTNTREIQTILRETGKIICQQTGKSGRN